MDRFVGKLVQRMRNTLVAEVSDMKTEVTTGPAAVSLVTTECVGCVGMKAEKPPGPAEILSQFVTSHRHWFSGGPAWPRPELIEGQSSTIREVLKAEIALTDGARRLISQKVFLLSWYQLRKRKLTTPGLVRIEPKRRVG